MIVIKTLACFSDVRVRKILAALKQSKRDVLFSGAISDPSILDFRISEIKYSFSKRRKSKFSLIKIAYLDFLKVINLNKKDTLYIVDEGIGFILLPVIIFLRLKKVNLVLDLFDSLYLKFNRNYFIEVACTMFYKLFNIVIVTDENRYEIMKKLMKPNQIKVVENYPFYKPMNLTQKPSGIINLFFYGLLSHSRGWDLVRKFEKKEPFHVYIAGRDNIGISKDNLPLNFTFLDRMKQDEVLSFMNKNIHWIFALYEPNNDNNLNASPNKIYEALQSNCGIIINSEVKISEFVRKNDFGVVVESFYNNSIDDLVPKLLNPNFKFTKAKKLKYSFDQYLDFYKTMN